MEYQNLDIFRTNTISLTKLSPVLSFNGQKSYLAPTMLPDNHTGHFQVEIPLSNFIGFNRSFLFVKYLFLDKRFNIISSKGGTIHNTDEATLKIERINIQEKIYIPSKSRYLIIYSGPEKERSIQLQVETDNAGDFTHSIIRYDLIGKPVGNMLLHF